MSKTKFLLILVITVAALGRSARAEESAPPPPAPIPAAPETAAPTPAATTVATGNVTPTPVPALPPPPYSLPWQLRAAGVANVVRADSAVAFYDNNGMGASGSTVATMLTASYKVTPSLAPLVRLGFVQNDAPAAGADGKSFINPIIGAAYGKRVDALRWAAFLGTTVPIGMGAGNTPDAGAATANTAGVRARSAMDNSMFAVNYLTVIGGGDLAYVDHNLTVQLEATLFQLMRVRGDNAPSATDSSRTNSTVGLHAGYFIIPMLSLGGEIRYQRWLTTPTQLNAMGAKVDIADVAKDTLTVAIGPRAHIQVSKGMFLRPGIAYARALDKPVSDASYNVLQIDLPLYF
ncbi:MAG TPA: hypothetical protein VN903_02900 [Polyangia bacterium]|jgi:hypothetical protein|nr:hypothetical protein [Polyangia bacterium]